ncbi:MAG: hypothetical protein P8R42_09890 [Candidatus Binatia bacterium]|nr:hypothetical protein [Candidatus Binatia bacterium]
MPLFVQRGRLGLGWRYVQAVVDAATVVIAVLVANPFDAPVLPPQIQLRFSNELYLCGRVGLSALSYAPRLVLWTGLVGAATWSLAVAWVIWLPETTLSLPAE